MPRYKFTLEYHGGGFVGWQRQANGLSVQEVLERALGELEGASVAVQGAGRTDAGVHALAQVAHADLSKDWRPDRLRDALNAWVRPHAVSILQAEQKPTTFEARFSATGRRYVYRILDRRAPPALERGLVWHVPRRLDAQAMNEAAQALVGRHDFTTFRAAECQASGPVRTLDRLDVVRTGDVVEIFADARSFLHHQVRSMVGALHYVGTGKWTRADLAAALAACDRARCAAVAPACGLYLHSVDY
ncbi:MAG TPA: tRNA pseudouridine(38-40) synthase TruA [Beijerinckiaceae bacterium]|nr:tRNA pseudouridine(38-40) synthase TruA [Beijerinckiaceae bacterium]